MTELSHRRRAAFTCSLFLAAGCAAPVTPPPSLLSAAGNGDTEQVRALLDHGASTEERDDAGRTPLILAVRPQGLFPPRVR